VTTVAMPLGELGAAAVDVLAELLDGGSPTSQVLGSAPELVERASTAPPPP
jgi:DNA-binding LacI/PurR family transcriptional regulator